MNKLSGYPKVLIVGEIFRLNGGGGITMSNLFKNWPTNNLAVIANGIEKASGEICHNYYQLGNKEIKFLFPFNIFDKPKKSGPVTINANNKINQISELKQNNSVGLNFIKKTLKLPFNILDIDHTNPRFNISFNLKQWIIDFHPDILYCQIFSLFTMEMIDQIHGAINKPLVIHIMDDFVNIIVKSGLLKPYWQIKLNNKFQNLINKASLCLSISKYMSLEYEKRYNKKFYDFRNPVEVSLWLPFSKSNWECNTKIKMLHAGRLVSPVSQALFDICEEVNNLNKNNIEFEFDITTFDNNEEFEKKIKDFVGININKPVRHEEMPQLITKYDLLVLPIDFNRQGIRYAKYSVSTKTSEFLISGVPILVYAPEEVALYRYFYENDLGFTAKKRTEINKLLLKIKSDSVGREYYGKKAVEFAKSTEDSVIIREKFRALLANTIM